MESKSIKLKIISNVIFFCLIMLSSNLFAQREDVVIMQNGDHITGEIKRLEFGILVFKTDDIETLNIKWDKIHQVSSKDYFEVRLEDGRVYFGSIEPSENEGIVSVKGVTLETNLFMKYIVKITPIKESFWDILDGYFKVGIGYTKASDIGQFTIGANAKYRTKTNYSELNLNSNITTTNQDPTSRKQDITYTFRRFMENTWFWGALAGAEENTELGVQLRASIGGGFGNNLIQTNHNWLYMLGGLNLNREWFTDNTKAQFNIEALLNTQYQIFIYDHPKVSLNTNLNVFPSLTDLGRIRSDFQVDLNWELIIDLYWVLSFYFNYDNKPQSTTSSTTDYKIDTSFKYEF